MSNGTTTKTTTEGGTMSDTERQAYQAGVADRMHGYNQAIATCRKRAAAGDKACAAYVKGFEGCGAGE